MYHRSLSEWDAHTAHPFRLFIDLVYIGIEICHVKNRMKTYIFFIWNVETPPYGQTQKKGENINIKIYSEEDQCLVPESTVSRLCSIVKKGCRLWSRESRHLWLDRKQLVIVCPLVKSRLMIRNPFFTVNTLKCSSIVNWENLYSKDFTHKSTGLYWSYISHINLLNF